MRLLGGPVLPRNAATCTCSHLDFENFPAGEIPDPCLQGEGNEGEGEE